MAGRFYCLLLNRGFSLFEVMIALAILAIALLALMDGGLETVRNFTKLRDRTISHWLALNTVNKLQLGLLSSSNNGSRVGIKPASLSGTTQMANQNWGWQLTAQNISSQSLNMIKVTVKITSQPSGKFMDSYIAYAPAKPSQ